MKEKYILAPGASGTELLRSLAKNGINTIGVRIVNALELAKIALMKSGISITEEFLTTKEEPSVIFSFLNGIPFFNAGSFADAENLSSALGMMRHLIPNDEENEINKGLFKGEFVEKNSAILEVYRQYISVCKAKNKIDSIGIIRKAIAESVAFPGEYYTLREYPVSMLGKTLISKVSGGSVKEISIIDLFEKNSMPLNNLTYSEGYGTINEVDGIISEIYEKTLPVDSCTIACADVSSYSQVFFDVAKRYEIPLTFGAGVPISNSYPANLLKLVYEWNAKGYNGIDAVRRILLSDSFDRRKLAILFGLGEEDKLERNELEDIAEMCGNLRIGFDPAINSSRLTALQQVLIEDHEAAVKLGRAKEIRAAERRLCTYDRVLKLSVEFEKGCGAFIDKFAVIRPEPIGRIDQSAINVIKESLDAYEKYAVNGSLDEIVPQILNKTVCSENSREGSLHITTISGAMSAIRNNLFICGLSAAEFPGSPKENYLLLDNDLLAFAAAEDAPTSTNRIAQKKAGLDSLLNLAMALGSNVQLSFSGYDLATLHGTNPSSVLFGIYESETGGKGMDEFKKSLNQYEYFGGKISDARFVGKAYTEGKDVVPHSESTILPDASSILGKAWSPSALEIFFQCPRHFYLTKVLGIEETEDNDPFMVISAADMGTLAHSMMESLAAKEMDKKEFLEESGKLFDRFLISRPPIHANSAQREKTAFLLMMEKAYDLDPKNEVLSAEEAYDYEHPSGVKLHGYPDRVEMDSDGKYIVADFKSKRKREHNENDINTCFQVVVYAWLCNQAGIPVTRCDYRYLRLKKNVSCKYDKEMEALLNEKLESFKNAVLTNSFPRNENDASCKYCRLAGICNYTVSNVGEEESNA